MVSGMVGKGAAIQAVWAAGFDGQNRFRQMTTTATGKTKFSVTTTNCTRRQRGIVSLRRAGERSLVLHAAPDGGPLDPDSGEEELLRRDMERFQRREDAARPANPTQVTTASSSGSAKEILDKVLIADFFFVCAALAWLLIGVLQQASSRQTGLLDVWYLLWPLVFQPAIGVLMLGVLASGLVGRLSGSDGKQ